MRGNHLTFLIGCLALPLAAKAAPPPVSAYAALPTAVLPRLSPDGSAIAMIGTQNGTAAFVIMHLDGKPMQVFSTGTWTPRWIEWKSPTLLVAGLQTTLKDWNRNSIRSNTRLLVLSADGHKVMPIELMGANGYVPLASDRVTSMLPDDPDHVLMATLGATVSRIDLRDGSRSVVQDSRSDVYNWYADSAGVIRAGVKYRNDPTTGRRPVVELLARASADDGWHTVTTEKLDGTVGLDFAGMDPSDPDRVLLDDDGPGGNRVVRAYSIAAGQPQAIVAQVPGVDVRAIRRAGRMIGYRTLGMAAHFTYPQPDWQHDARAIAHALGSGEVELLDRTADGKHVLACLHDGMAPDQFWMLDRSGGKTSLHAVLGTYEAIPATQYAEANWISYTAADGMHIQAILTLPPGHAAGKPLPFVVLPHGGPGVHEEFGFDWLAQFIASRGYGVLQPEFRGSAGFGRALYDAGRGQWGGAMQDDITAGTKYLIAQHLADPARIAIVGASFGGYAALEGVEREQHLYRAAAALSPVTDLPMMFGGMGQFAHPGLDLLMPAGDFQTMQNASPVQAADRIMVPVLLIHGSRDFTVPVQQTEMMASAMKRAGKQVQAIYLDGADHYLERAADRAAWLNALEQFLASHIGGNSLP